ncbi:MAG TPA: hypothetical protein VHK65_13925 [Candidatus Dormibacteraeota bacterium]|nr:hypothetical protein [Candidatus Dormibacteraeota bacterium]
MAQPGPPAPLAQPEQSDLRVLPDQMAQPGPPAPLAQREQSAQPVPLDQQAHKDRQEGQGG